MTMVAGGLAGVAYVADDLPLGNMLSDFHSIALQVGVQGAPAVALAVRAVVDDHKVAPAVMLVGLDDNAIGRG